MPVRDRVGARVPPDVAAAAAAKVAQARFMAELEDGGSSSEEEFDVVSYPKDMYVRRYMRNPCVG